MPVQIGLLTEAPVAQWAPEKRREKKQQQKQSVVWVIESRNEGKRGKHDALMSKIIIIIISIWLSATVVRGVQEKPKKKEFRRRRNIFI